MFLPQRTLHFLDDLYMWLGSTQKFCQMREEYELLLYVYNMAVKHIVSCIMETHEI